MKLDMLESQLAALEPPPAGEALVIDAALPPDAIVDMVRSGFSLE